MQAQHQRGGEPGRHDLRPDAGAERADGAGLCPRRVQACASNCTVEVLPLVPVTPTVVISPRWGMAVERSAIAPMRRAGPATGMAHPPARANPGRCGRLEQDRGGAGAHRRRRRNSGHARRTRRWRRRRPAGLAAVLHQAGDRAVGDSPFRSGEQSPSSMATAVIDGGGRCRRAGGGGGGRRRPPDRRRGGSVSCRQPRIEVVRRPCPSAAIAPSITRPNTGADTVPPKCSRPAGPS